MWNNLVKPLFNPLHQPPRTRNPVWQPPGLWFVHHRLIRQRKSDQFHGILVGKFGAHENVYEEEYNEGRNDTEKRDWLGGLRPLLEVCLGDWFALHFPVAETVGVSERISEDGHC